MPDDTPAPDDPRPGPVVERDARGRVVRVSDPVLGPVTRTAYDADGRPLPPPPGHPAGDGPDDPFIVGG